MAAPGTRQVISTVLVRYHTMHCCSFDSTAICRPRRRDRRTDGQVRPIMRPIRKSA